VPKLSCGRQKKHLVPEDVRLPRGCYCLGTHFRLRGGQVLRGQVLPLTVAPLQQDNGALSYLGGLPRVALVVYGVDGALGSRRAGAGTDKGITALTPDQMSSSPQRSRPKTPRCVSRQLSAWVWASAGAGPSQVSTGEFPLEATPALTRRPCQA
jgi:hypothetical protein